MKKIIIWIFSVIAVTVCIDTAFGFVFDRYTSTNQLGGDYDMSDHVIKDFDDDILVLGSSVALNSIDTRKLSDSMDIKAYNAGSNGQAFPFYLTMLKCALQSDRKPNTVMLGLTADNMCDNGTGDRYNFLSPYYGNDIGDIDSVMNSIKPFNTLLLRSNLYRYNQAWLRIILYHFITPGITGENGFIAKDIPPHFPQKHNITENRTISHERRKQINEFVRLCDENDIQLIIFFPPRYVNGYKAIPLDSVARNAVIWDDTTLAPFTNDSTLFYDYTHLNIKGACIYTDSIISRLKKTPTCL